MEAVAEVERVVICGSREWTYTRMIEDRVKKLPEGTLVITGGARGADTIAHKAAIDCDLETAVFRPNWSEHGKRAGMVRNVEMLKQCPAKVIAFWDGSSPGTGHTIAEARRRGIPVEVHLSG